MSQDHRFIELQLTYYTSTRTPFAITLSKTVATLAMPASRASKRNSVFLANNTAGAW